LHCTEVSLAGALAEFQRVEGRKVSARYVIDRNGDIYQMVNDADCANHCMGANASSIGIEHVGSETDALAAPQAAVSAALIRWLLQEYQIPAHKHLRPRFHAGLLPTGRNQLSGQAFRTGAFASNNRCLGRG
jgi:N-acetyl-anhydromuramyl-L-alanine amidase AmpD